MYLNHYQFRAKPFSLSPSPKFLWLGEKHGEALATLKYGVGSDMGFVLMTGDVGVGKTALVHRLISTMDDSTHLAYITDPSVSINDFFQLLAAEFKIAGRFHGKAHFLIHLEEFLHRAHRENRRVLLIIDEAQRLTDRMLDEIRVLSNIELSDKKLLTIFLVGQPEFIHLITTQKNRAIRQRIAVNCQILPLDEAETGQYIEHRLRVVGASHPIFKPDAIHEIYRITGGYPRAINILCDHALVQGYISDRQTIDAETIQACEDGFHIQPVREHRSPDKPPAPQTEAAPAKRPWLASQAVALVSGICIAFICFAAVYVLWLEPQLAPQKQSATIIETPAQVMPEKVVRGKVTPPVQPDSMAAAPDEDTTAQSREATADGSPDAEQTLTVLIARARPTDPLPQGQLPADNGITSPSAPPSAVDPGSLTEWTHWPQTDLSGQRSAQNEASDSEGPSVDGSPPTGVQSDPATTPQPPTTSADRVAVPADSEPTLPADQEASTGRETVTSTGSATQGAGTAPPAVQASPASRSEQAPRRSTAGGLAAVEESPAEMATSTNDNALATVTQPPPPPQVGGQAPAASGKDINARDKQPQRGNIEPEPTPPAAPGNVDDGSPDSTATDNRAAVVAIAGNTPSPGPTATEKPAGPPPTPAPAAAAAATQATGQPPATAARSTGPSSQQAPADDSAQATPLTAAAPSPSTVATASAEADDATNPAAKQSMEARIRSFLDTYTGTYAAKDLERFTRFFTASAMENGKPFSTLVPKYERNFTLIEAIEYRIELQRFSPTESRELVQIEGNFFLRWLPRDNRWRENSGTISMQLKENGPSFLVQRLDYQGGRSPKN